MDNITGVIKQYKCILRIDEPYQTNLQKPLAPNMRASSKQSWATVYVHPSSSAGLKSQNERKAGWTFFSLCIFKQSVSETMMCCTSTGLESSCFVISVQSATPSLVRAGLLEIAWSVCAIVSRGLHGNWNCSYD